VPLSISSVPLIPRQTVNRIVRGDDHLARSAERQPHQIHSGDHNLCRAPSGEMRTMPRRPRSEAAT